jgi:hypothetical protein
MLSNVEVDQRPPAMLDEEEHVQRPEGQGVDGEEVACPHLRGMIGKERSPRLRGRASISLQSIPTNGLGANFESQRQKLAADPFRAPAWVLGGHPKNQATHLCRDGWPAWSAVPTLERPVPLPRAVMPSHDSVWLDDDQGMAPARPESREQSPDKAVPFSQARPSFLSLVDRELMPQRKVLHNQVDA